MNDDDDDYECLRFSRVFIAVSKQSRGPSVKSTVKQQWIVVALITLGNDDHASGNRWFD